MSYSPYIPNIDAWKHHFQNPPKETKSFYTIGLAKHHGQNMEPIKLISPTEQVVEQAKSVMKRKRENDDFDTYNFKKKKRKTNKKVIKKSSQKRKKKNK